LRSILNLRPERLAAGAEEGAVGVEQGAAFSLQCESSRKFSFSIYLIQQESKHSQIRAVFVFLPLQQHRKVLKIHWW
jgi:hypothetical protein